MTSQVEETRVFRKIKKDKYDETTETYEELDYSSVPVETFQISEIKSKKDIKVRRALTVCVSSLGVFLILSAMVWTMTPTALPTTTTTTPLTTINEVSRGTEELT